MPAIHIYIYIYFKVQTKLVEALACAEAEKASFELILEPEWQGDGKQQLATLDTAIKDLEKATTRFEVIAEQM